jgi:outer membrane protein assembly factor BamB
VESFSSPLPFITLTSGNTVSSTSDGIVPLEAGDIFEGGDTIQTNKKSIVQFQDGENALFRLEAEGRLTLERISRREMVIFLENGILLAMTFHEKLDKIYEVRTPNARVRFASVVMVRYNNKNTFVTLNEGKATVYCSDAERDLLPGQSVTVGEDGRFTKGKNDILAPEFLRRFEHVERVSDEKENLPVFIKTGKNDVTVVVDGETLGEFSKYVSILLPKGQHTVTLEKKGYTPYHTDISLKERKIELIDDVFWQKENDEKEWHAHTVYKYLDRDDPAESAILGFALSSDYAMAVTKNALLCFKTDGTLLWEKVFGKSRRIFFDSLPLIYLHKLYVSANDRLLVIELPSGQETIIETPGMISDGFHISLYKGKLYFPFPDGIYLFDPRTGIMDRSARYTAPGPASPLITGKGIYIASVVSNDMIFYSHDGKVSRSVVLDAPVLCPPIESGGYIIVGDSKGVIYRFNPSLEIVDSFHAGGGVQSLLAFGEHTLYVFNGNGTLQFLRLDDMTVWKDIKVDNTPDSVIYSFKRPVLVGNELFIGTDSGTMLIIDSETGRVNGRPVVADSGISCSVYRADNVLFSGTVGGDVILFE